MAGPARPETARKHNKYKLFRAYCLVSDHGDRDSVPYRTRRAQITTKGVTRQLRRTLDKETLKLHTMEHPSYRAYCSRYRYGYRLTVVMDPYLTIKIDSKFVPYNKLLAETDPQIHRETIGVLINIVDRWIERCFAENIQLRDVELVLPPMGNYLDPSDEIGEHINRKYGIDFSIVIGVQISSELPEKLNTTYARRILRKMKNANGEMN